MEMKPVRVSDLTFRDNPGRDYSSSVSVDSPSGVNDARRHQQKQEFENLFGKESNTGRSLPEDAAFDKVSKPEEAGSDPKEAHRDSKSEEGGLGEGEYWEVGNEPSTDMNDHFQMTHSMVGEANQFYQCVSGTGMTSQISSSTDDMAQLIEGQVQRLMVNAKQSSWSPTEMVHIQLKEELFPGTTISLQQSAQGSWRILASCRQSDIREILQRTLPGLQQRFREKQLGDLEIADVMLESDLEGGRW
ncbi:hypothetical protein [Hahella ganghwensis]|uniref:hypothetical protein n=1 Tax=Hahella ganghwensis TaxID=286420 RepID=UPI000376EF0D|nr:hypothetical protein [Hahella ganghwensis]